MTTAPLYAYITEHSCMQLSFVQKKNCRLIHKFLIKISNGITMHFDASALSTIHRCAIESSNETKDKKTKRTREEEEKKNNQNETPYRIIIIETR